MSRLVLWQPTMGCLLVVGAVASLTECGGTARRDAASCSPGERSTRPCGVCGEQHRDCGDGTFGGWGACIECDATVDADSNADVSSDAPPDAAPDAFEDAAPDAVADAAPEVASDGAPEDAAEDADGAVPDAGACPTVAPGPVHLLAIPAPLTKLIRDPTRCRIYGALANSSVIVAIDTVTKSVAATVDLGAVVSDLDLSPNGAQLLVAQAPMKQVTLVDPSSLTVTGTFPTLETPARIEISNAGLAYYAPLALGGVHGLDLNASPAADTVISDNEFIDAADLELSASGGTLYVGESNTSSGELYALDVGANPVQVLGTASWNASGFYNPERHTYLGPSEQYLYYGGYQLDAKNPAFIRGHMGEKVFAEDAAATFAVGETGLYDAALVTKIGSLPLKAAAAALALGDQELWFAVAGEPNARYVNMASLLGNATLGQRKHPASSVGTYTFARLVADPVRPRLYGLDVNAQSVISIDTTTLATIDEITVGSNPTDLGMAPLGSRIYVGHAGTQALAVIDAASFDFVGFLPTKRVPYHVAPVADGQLVVIDKGQWTTQTLIDAASGQELESTYAAFYEGVLAAAAGGKVLFGADTTSGNTIIRYAVSAGHLTPTSKGTPSFSSVANMLLALPDASGVFYAGQLLNGNDLSVTEHMQAQTIRAVTSDSLKATSDVAVYRVSDGANLGPLPAIGAVQAASASGETVYICTWTGIAKVDLTPY